MLVAFLSNDDPASEKYALQTKKTFSTLDLNFELRKVKKEDLEDEIIKANNDKSVNGMMVYYPIFNNRQVFFYTKLGSIYSKCS